MIKSPGNKLKTAVFSVLLGAAAGGLIISSILAANQYGSFDFSQITCRILNKDAFTSSEVSRATMEYEIVNDSQKNIVYMTVETQVYRDGEYVGSYSTDFDYYLPAWDQVTYEVRVTEKEVSRNVINALTKYDLDDLYFEFYLSWMQIDTNTGPRTLDTKNALIGTTGTRRA